MRTLFTWVHLADLNDLDARLENWNQDPTPPELALQLDVLRVAREAARPNAIFVTGDVKLDRDNDYQRARDVLLSIASDCLLDERDVFVVPGNHDVDLALRDRIIDRLIRSLREGEESLDDSLGAEQDRVLLERRFQAFLEFSSGLGSGAKLFWSESRTYQGVPFRFIGINTEFLFTGKGDGKLRLGNTQLATLTAQSTDEVVIVLSHHPWDSIFVADAPLARRELDARAHIHLVSASYLEDAIPLSFQGNGARVLGAGGRPTRQKPRPWSYYLASVLDLDNGQLITRIWPRQWSAKNRDFRLNVDAVPEGQRFVDLPLAKQRAIPASGTLVSNVVLNGSVGRRRWSPEEHVPYIEQVSLEKIGALHRMVWRPRAEPGWNVLIGDNGSGKTTFLRLLSYALVGTLWEVKDEKLLSVPPSLNKRLFDAADSNFELWMSSKESEFAQLPAAGMRMEGEEILLRITVRPDLRHLFHAGFGPFRRFTGGDEEFEKEQRQSPNAFRHISLFTERIAFHETLQWLKSLDHRAFRDPGAILILDAVKKFINNEHLLPNGVRLVEINADAILFEDGNKCRVELADLSDGYRSILSLSLELVRQLIGYYDLEGIFDADTHVVVAPGIVLIDEVDAHLHPSWQRVIGPCLRKLFPRFQFIVTTHSPLVCQGAADGFGSVFRLAKPGTTEDAKQLEGVELNRILYGNVLDAYGTGAFGEVERSAEGQQLRAELVALNLKELSKGLTADEERRQDELRAIFPGGK